MVVVTREDLTDFEKEFEEQASRYYNYNGPYDYLALRECCKELMVKAKEELMKEAVEGEITKDNRGNNVLRVGSLNNGFEIGDKVRIIIVKDK